MRTEYETETNRTKKKKFGPFKKASCAAEINTGYCYIVPWMFLYIAKSQKMGHDVEEKPGQIFRPQ